MAGGTEERELKLTVQEPGLLDRIASAATLGPFQATPTRLEVQRNAYFDTPTGALRRHYVSFRCRVTEGDQPAIWTIKGRSTVARGIAARPEVEVRLSGDTPPELALAVLTQAARAHGNAALAETVADALAGSPPPLAAPFARLDNPRRVRDLTAPERGWAAELALDRVHLESHGRYEHLEIEVELRQGDDAALHAACEAILVLGDAVESTHSKLSHALLHLSGCQGC